MTPDLRSVSTAGTTIPALDSGVTCLSTSSPHSVGFHQLALDALSSSGMAYWVDSRNVASTYTLYELARHDRVLSGLRIARAFTAYQHFSLCRELLHCVTSRTELVCLPNLTSLYRDDDVPEHEREMFLDTVLCGLAGLADTYDVPVLVSTAYDGDFADQLRASADRTIRCDRTQFGLRYEGEGVETTVYRDGAYWQTTIPYWVDLYGAVDDGSLVEAATAAEFAGVA